MNLIQQRGLSFELNNNDYTASVVSSKYSSGDILIPKTITHESHEYKITSIKKCSFKNNGIIRSISFPEDSELLSIEEDAFANSSLDNLTIPSKVKELKEGWCNDTPNLYHIFLSKNNKNFKYLAESDNEIIICKSNQKSDKNQKSDNSDENSENDDEFDSIVFACRNIEVAVIPSSIKYINSYSFSKCNKLDRIEFSSDSKLTKISKETFSYSSINSISIPKSVKIIETNAFSWCINLKTVIFSNDSELEKIEEKSFFDSMVETVTIPSKFADLNEGWCGNTSQLVHVTISKENKNVKFLDDEKKIIVGKSDKNNQNFDVILFASRDINEVFIPSSIKKIGKFAFSWCKDLKTVTFDKDSKLESIGESAFSDSSIFDILIPKSVTKIESNTFWWCRNLIEVNFSDDSELQSIEENSFTFSTIKKLSIPSKVKELKNGWCNLTPNLSHLNISKDNKHFKYLENSNEKIIVGRKSENEIEYNLIVFVCRDILNNTIIVPSFIEYIDPFSFSHCQKIQYVLFKNDSKLKSIGENAFAYSSIQEIKIPKNVEKIQLRTFYRCKQLKKVEFQENSELISIENEAFVESPIEFLFIPSKVENLKEGWCNDTPNLISILISKNNKNFKYLDGSENKIIIRKNCEDDEFNSIVFACRNIKIAKIPSFIKCIDPFSFSKCNKLKKIEFSQNSMLTKISKSTFSYSSINSISIPKSVRTIETNAFTRCKKLKVIEFNENSELQTIEEYSFSVSTLERISIPKLIDGIGRGSFSCCYSLHSFEFLGDELFIGHFCFNFCENLALASFPNAQKVTFSNDALNSASLDLIVFISPNAKLISNCRF